MVSPLLVKLANTFKGIDNVATFIPQTFYRLHLNREGLPKIFLALSDGYCDTHNAFLLNESSVTNNPSLVKLKLNKKEVKKLNKPKLSDKSEDSLYNLVKEYGF